MKLRVGKEVIIILVKKTTIYIDIEANGKILAMRDSPEHILETHSVKGVIRKIHSTGITVTKASSYMKDENLIINVPYSNIESINLIGEKHE